MLYIGLMFFSEFFLAPKHHPREGDGSCSSVATVRAQLGQDTDDANGFRVDLKFRNADGTLGKVRLTPLEAAALMSEIARAIDRGNRRQRRTPAYLRSMQNCCDG